MSGYNPFEPSASGRHPAVQDLERAALYVVGSLSDAEQQAVRAHAAVCAACREEIASLERTASDLVLAVTPVAPAPELRERLFARIAAGAGAGATAGVPRAKPNGSHQASGEQGLDALPPAPDVQTWRQWKSDAAPGLALVRGDAPFEPTGTPGIEVRKLHVDVPNDRVTMLVRMHPGSAYPAHRHGGAEECFVLEGSIQVGELTMHAGDYQRASGGSVHPVQSTIDGCLLLIVSSLSDELLEAR